MSNDPDEIRARIEGTQAALSRDVDALTEKVSPSRVMHRRVDRAREGAVNLKDKIMGSAQETTWAASDRMSSVSDKASGVASNVTDTVQSAPQAARRRTQGNPFAAGMVAFGLGWLVSSLVPSTQAERRLATQAKDQAGDMLQPVAEQAKAVASDMAENLREPAQQAVQSVKSTAQDAAGTVKDESMGAAQHVQGHAQDATQTTREHAR